MARLLRCWGIYSGTEALGRARKVACRADCGRSSPLRPFQNKAEDLRAPPEVGRATFAYARVSSRDQKADLECQKQVLEMYCAKHGWKFEIIADLGSGMNYHKKGLRRGGGSDPEPR